MIKSLGVKRQSKPVMPDDFYQITPTPPEDEKIARMRVAPETFLDLQRQSVHAAAHVAHATRQPDPNTGRNRDHRPPSAATTRRSVRPSTSRSTRSRQPFGSSISISPSGRSTKPHDGGRPAVSVATATGTKRAASPTPRAPSRYWRRQVNSRLRQTPCRCATADTEPPGRDASSTSRSLSATLQRRRRSTPVITSTRLPTTDLTPSPKVNKSPQHQPKPLTCKTALSGGSPRESVELRIDWLNSKGAGVVVGARGRTTLDPDEMPKVQIRRAEHVSLS